MATNATPASEPQASVGTVGRLTGALFDPKPTFEDIARRPSWIAPLLLLCLLSLVITYLFGQRVGWRGFMEKQLAKSSRVQQLPPERREEILEQQTKVAPIIGYVLGPVAIVVVALVIAGVLMGVFDGIAGAGLNFGTSLAIVSHAWMPGVVAQLLGILT
ncbi:MAG: YIP1 family protein [Candidatus Acidiferrales bacterium]